MGLAARLRFGTAVAGLAALTVTAGCASTAVKQAYYTTTGASARYYEVESLGAETSLLAYSSVQAEPFDTSPMRGAIPERTAARVVKAVETRANELDAFPGGEPVLRIRGKFHDYDPGGSAVRVVGFGTNPFLTAQIEVVDAQSGEVLGVAMVTGTVKSGVRVGPEEMADGVGKAVKALLKSHAKVPKE